MAYADRCVCVAFSVSVLALLVVSACAVSLVEFAVFGIADCGVLCVCVLCDSGGTFGVLLWSL